MSFEYHINVTIFLSSCYACKLKSSVGVFPQFFLSTALFLVTQVGKISKHWSGIAREAFTDADNFGVSFPMDLDVRMKATLLGALFLIDFMFFEKAKNEEGDGIGMF